MNERTKKKQQTKSLLFIISFSGYKATEIKTAFGESGVYLDDDEVAELVAEADENGDGVISFEGLF